MRLFGAEITDDDALQYITGLPTRYSHMEQARQEALINWYYYYGYHHLNFNRSMNTVTPVRVNTRQQTRHVKLMLNLYRPIIDSGVDILIQDRLRADVIPESDELLEVEGAKYATKVGNAPLNENDADERDRLALTSMKLDGTGFYSVEWDQSLGRMIAEQEDGGRVKEGGVYIGNPTVFDLYMPQGYATVAGMPDYLYETMVHKDLVSMHYKNLDLYGGNSSKSITTSISGPGGPGHHRRTLQGLIGIGADNYQGSDERDNVSVLTWYRKPCDYYTRGLYIVVVNGQIAERHDRTSSIGPDRKLQGLPTPDAYFPLIAMKDSPRHYNIISKPLGSQLRSPIRAIERNLSAAQEAINGGAFATILVQPNQIIGGDKAFNDLPLKVITYRALGAEPKLMRGDPVDASVFNMVNLLWGLTRTIGDYQEVRSGEGVPNARTVGQTELNLAQNITKLAGNKNSYHRAREDMTRMCLEEIHEHYEPERKITAMGTNGMYGVFAYEKTRMSRSTQTRVNVSPFSFGTREARSAQANTLWRGQVLQARFSQDPAQRDAAKHMLKLLNMESDTDNIPTEESCNKGLAEYESMIIGELARKVSSDAMSAAVAETEMPPVQEIQNHMVHIEYHQQPMLSPAYMKDFTSSQQGKARYALDLAHIKQHEAALEAEETAARHKAIQQEIEQELMMREALAPPPGAGQVDNSAPSDTMGGG